MRPFEYAFLDSGEIVCVMWPSLRDGSPLGFVWYTLRAGVSYSDSEGLSPFEKIYRNNNRADHDHYVMRKLPHLAELDAMGGWMVRLPPKSVTRVMPRRLLAPADVGGEDIFQRIVHLLGTKESELEVTGSTLWGGNTPDRDIVVSSIRSGKLVSQRIRNLIATDLTSRLPTDHWNDRVHHRRFRYDDVEVCFRTPLDHVSSQAGFELPQLAEPEDWRAISFRGRVQDDRFGHCTPTILKIRVSEWLRESSPMTTVYVTSSEGAHAMRFVVDDEIQVDRAHLVSARGQDPPLVSIWMGEAMRLRPTQLPWWAR